MWRMHVNIHAANVYVGGPFIVGPADSLDLDDMWCRDLSNSSRSTWSSVSLLKNYCVLATRTLTQLPVILIRTFIYYMPCPAQKSWMSRTSASPTCPPHRRSWRRNLFWVRMDLTCPQLQCKDSRHRSNLKWAREDLERDSGQLCCLSPLHHCLRCLLGAPLPSPPLLCWTWVSWRRDRTSGWAHYSLMCLE